MSDNLNVQSILDQLQARKGNLTCKDVQKLLKSLGFDVKDGRKGGHKVYTHDRLSEFKSASFNCGHGRNPEIKPAYILNIIKVIEQFKETLEEEFEEG